MGGTGTTNQPPALEPYNVFTSDPVLGAAVEREGGSADIGDLTAFGERVGSAEVFDWGHQANRHEPELVTHDRFGDRIDEVHHHPAYHSLMQLSVSEGLHCRHYDGAPGDGGYVARNAAMLLMAQVEVGHQCPISMTGAALYAMDHQPDLAETWGPRVRSRVYDPVLAPPDQKSGVLLGMSMTERQSGSDVRGQHIDLLPRVRPDGTRNSVHLMRLKDKLGNRSNASSEMELADATAWLVRWSAWAATARCLYFRAGTKYLIDDRVDRAIQQTGHALSRIPHHEIDGRRLVEQLAVTWTAKLARSPRRPTRRRHLPALPPRPRLGHRTRHPPRRRSAGRNRPTISPPSLIDAAAG